MSSNTLLKDAWKKLDESIITYKGEPVGTLAAVDSSMDSLNYDQVFTRDFAVSAFAFLMNDRTEIVKNFLRETGNLQSREKHLDCFKPGEGLIPASFKVESKYGKEIIIPDFGEKAIARVAPVDSGFWWLYILRAYVKATDDWEFAYSDEIQKTIRLILELSLVAKFDMFPTLLVPDGSFMIDRRMGVYGYPLEIQALFYTALRLARELLKNTEENQEYIEAVRERLGHLTYHLRKYYWLDFNKLNEIYRYNVEEYSENAINNFNIYPDTIPGWLYDWIPENGGYFAGNLGPARMDFRFFSSGNLLSVISSLSDAGQSTAIINLFSEHWDELIGKMPLKLCYPALEGRDWEVLTGHDPKNIPWSYHNAGSWPFLLWSFAAAAQKVNRADLAIDAVKTAEKRILNDNWPEYYGGKQNNLIGKEARFNQTWTIAGYIAAKTLIENPEKLAILDFEEDNEVLACSVRIGEDLEH